jgi:mycoredoxin
MGGERGFNRLMEAAAQAEAGITMYTRDGCGDCYVAKRVMAQFSVPYKEIDIWEHDWAREEVRRINKGRQSVPTIIFPSGRIMVEPTHRELELALRDEQLIA